MATRQKRKGIRDGEFVDLNSNDIDYVLDDNTSLLGPTINLAPLQNAVSSQRLFYSSRFSSQADSLEDPDEPWVQNQATPDGKSFDELLGRKSGAVESPFDGVVERVSDKNIKLRNASGESQEFPLYNHFSLNRKNQFHQTPLVKLGDTITKGQVIAKSNFTNEKGSLALGRNARIGVVPYLGYSMDDATVISESFSKRLTSNHLLDYETDNNDEGMRREKNHYMSVFPKQFTNIQLDKVDDKGIAKPGSILEKGDPITLGSLPPMVREEDKVKGSFGRYLRNRRRDVTQTWKYNEPGNVRDVVERNDGTYAVTVETHRPAKDSDKLVVRSGAKFTISKIIPDAEMPRNAEGTPFDMLANPLGIPSRQNPSFIMELLLGKIAEKRGKKIVMPAFNDPNKKWTETIRQMLEKEGIEDTEKVWDPVAQQFLENPITTGNMHVLKLIHQSEGKMSARGQGGYTQWEQPRKGGDEMGQAKRFSGLELSGLLSAGAYGYIKDAATVRGQRNDEYWRALRSGKTPPKPGQPFAWDRTQALLHGSGYMTRDMGAGKQRLGPLTDVEVESFKAEELKSADMISFKNGKAIPGGLFDEARANNNRWAKISLDYPLPNPAFEKPILKLLGLRKVDMENIITGTQELDDYGSGPEALYKALKAINHKELKAEMLAVVKSGVKTKRPRAIDTLNTLEGLERNKLAPQELMITQVPVIPSRFRPFAFQGDVFLPGDVNELYTDVFRLRDQNREIRDNLGGEAAGDHRMDVYNGMRALYGTSGTKNRKLQEKNVEGFLRQVLGSSPKYSVFQRNLFSKTVDSSARGVAGLDPTLGIDEVSIPADIAWKLYAPYVQRRLVKRGMEPADALKAVDERTKSAEAALKSELAVRPGVVNRAPAWHKFNSTGAYFKVHEGPNIQVNPLITAGHNMDFNGDANIGYVVMRAGRETISRLFKKGLTRVVGRDAIQSMYKDIQIPLVVGDQDVAVVDLADFPREKFIRSKEGKNGPILFYEVPENTKIIAYDEVLRKPVWSPVSQFSIHIDLEVEIVNLTGKAQIITDDDPRAVYGVDPTTVGFKMERFTPREAESKRVIVARGRTNHDLSSENGVIQSWSFGDKELTLDPGFGYVLGAMAGDGWTDAAGGNRWYISDLPGNNAAKLNTWFQQNFPDTKMGKREMLKADDTSRYGDTVKFSFSSVNWGNAITRDLKTILGGAGNTSTAGSGTKRLPAFAGMSPRVFIEGVLAGLIDTDGSISNSGSDSKRNKQLTVNVTSTSLELLRMAKFLFSLLGMNSTISFSKTTKRNNAAWLLVVSAVDAYNKLGPIVENMVSTNKLNAFHASVQPGAESASYQRSQMLPLTRSLYALLYSASPAPKLSKRLRDAGGEELEIVRKFNSLKTKLGSIKRTGDHRVSRELVNRFLSLVKHNAGRFNKDKLRKLFESEEWAEFLVLHETPEICWLAVESVDYTGKKETGYDLTVPGYETFMNSDGVVLSNTLGIFVPSLPEAVEDVKNRLMPSKQIFSIRDPDKVMNAPQQDLILGLWNAANSPSKKTHVFETEREAILAIQQGRVSLSDEVKINQKKAASLVESHTEEIFNKQALQTKTARYGAGVLFRNPDGTYLLEENQPEKGLPDEYVGKLRPAGGGKSKSDKNLRETIIREIGEEFGLSEDFVKDRIKLIGYINHGKFEDCAMFEMVDHGLKPGVYQATNSPTEKIKLVKSTLEDPLYVGVHPKKLRKYSLRGYRGMGRNKNKITPWVGVDLDGTLAEIGDEEFNIMHIGKPVPKMVAKVKHLMKNNTVKIFTARAQNPKSIPAIEDWCRRYLGEVLEVTNIKDPGMQYLMDDRAVSIEKNMGTVKKATINDGKTLNKVATVGDWGHDLQVPSTPTEPASLNTEPKVVTQAPSKYGFDAATKRLLEREGGNTLVTDSGGLTRFGISQNAHPDTNITDITEQQSIDIYRTQYWPSDLDDFPRVQEKLYDLRVNAGPRSNRWLQSSINKLGGDIKVDGHLGPLTLKAMGTVDQGQLFKALQERQIEYYNHLIKVNPAKYKQYYNEWMHRSKFDPLDYYE